MWDLKWSGDVVGLNLGADNLRYVLKISLKPFGPAQLVST